MVLDEEEAGKLEDKDEIILSLSPSLHQTLNPEKRKRYLRIKPNSDADNGRN